MADTFTTFVMEILDKSGKELMAAEDEQARTYELYMKAIDKCHQYQKQIDDYERHMVKYKDRTDIPKKISEMREKMVQYKCAERETKLAHENATMLVAILDMKRNPEYIFEQAKAAGFLF